MNAKLGAVLAVVLVLVGSGMALALGNMVRSSGEANPVSIAATTPKKYGDVIGVQGFPMTEHREMQGAMHRGPMAPRGKAVASKAMARKAGIIWGIASRIEEARNYTGTVVKADVPRGIIVLEVEGSNIAFKLHPVYVDEAQGYLVMGGWIAGSIQQGQQLEITGLGSDHAKLALALYYEGHAYLAPQYYKATHTG